MGSNTIIPDDETILAEGKITLFQPGGGGELFTPTYIMIRVKTAEGDRNFTLNGHTCSHHNCYTCDNRTGTTYGKGYSVIVSRVNGCGCLVVHAI